MKNCKNHIDIFCDGVSILEFLQLLTCLLPGGSLRTRGFFLAS